MAQKRSDLIQAIEGLTLQIKRYNDAHGPIEIKGRGEAELFKATYTRETEEEREGREYLENLHASGDEPLSHDEPQAVRRKTRRS
jgi:hypothetical protein